MICDTNFDDELYDSTIDFIKDNVEFGISSLLKSKGFYELLSPQ